MSGHTDTVSGLKLSPDGSFLLSNSMDNTGMYKIQNSLPKKAFLKNLTKLIIQLRSYLKPYVYSFANVSFGQVRISTLDYNNPTLWSLISVLFLTLTKRLKTHISD
jgi:WD40 repeat protein